MGASAGDLPGLGGSLALSLLSLAMVCLSAYVVLRWLSRRGVGRSDGPVRVLARCPLEPKRAVYLVQAGGRCFLVGVGDGPMAMLAELDPASVKSESSESVNPSAGSRFAEMLARIRTREKS
jgi:flagellar biosynthetic protein FliO